MSVKWCASECAAIARKCAGGRSGEMAGNGRRRSGQARERDVEVGRLACLIDDLNCMLYCVMAEQQCEGDEDSPLPGLMAGNLDSMLDTLLAMVEEERQNFATTFKIGWGSAQKVSG